MSIHFGTFGSTPLYSTALARIKKEAEASGLFQTVDIYTQANLQSLKQHEGFIKKNPRGYGYWIYKPLVLLDMMSRYPENDIVVYADAGCSIRATPLWNEWIQGIHAHPTHRITVIHDAYNPEYTWTKADLYTYLDIPMESSIELNGQPTVVQSLGGIQAMMNTAENRTLITEWYTTMVADNYCYLTDSKSRIPNHPTFKAHRHDQSIISLLMKKRGAYAVAENKVIAPIVASRLRGETGRRHRRRLR
jgi:hypothetical protein